MIVLNLLTTDVKTVVFHLKKTGEKEMKKCITILTGFFLIPIIVKPASSVTSLTGCETIGCGMGYECINNQCVKTFCISGAFGLGLATCEICPDPDGIYIDSSLQVHAGATSIEGQNFTIDDCFLSQGTLYDATGTFTLLENCPY